MMQLPSILLHIALVFCLNQCYQTVAGQEDKTKLLEDATIQCGVSIPTFWNCVHPAISYLANYTVTHEPIKLNNQTSTNTKLASTTRISEFFDRGSRLGKIVTQTGDSQSVIQETYIDGNGKSIYSFVPSTGNCKRIEVIARLFDGFLEGNVDFNMDKLYGLAALWIKLESLNGHYQLKVSKRAKTIGKSNYSYQLEAMKTNQSVSIGVNYNLQMNFIATGNLSKQEVGSFTLQSVNFEPKYEDDQSERHKTLHRTIINVELFTKNPNIKWKLPKRCADLRDRLDDSFPEIGYLLEGDHGQMFIKSELIISSTSATNEKTKIHVMEEWLHGGKFRLKTFGRAKNLDILYFNKTKDVLDISRPYHCDNSWPKFKQPLPADTSKQVGFEEFWSGETNLVDDLSLLYYGPMSLWYLAERNRAHAKLINTLDLAPLPLGDRANGERELRTEKWTLVGPNGLKPSIFNLYFVQISGFSRDRKRILRWHRIDRIELIDGETTVRINIINYRYKLREREIMDKFKVPEGYLCRQSHDHSLEKHFDKLNLDLRLGYSMWYEASLEVVDDAGESEWLDGSEGLGGDMMVPNTRVCSSVSGRIIRIQETNADIGDHYQRIAYKNGSSSAKRFVHDRKSGLAYIEDQSKGSCEVSSFQESTDIHDWVLQFFIGDRAETLILDEEMLQLLFGQANNDYYARNMYYQRGNLSIISYERELKQFPNKAQHNEYLNQDSQATIVRRYQENVGSHGRCFNEGNCTFHLYDGMSVRVFLLDESRTKLRAVLSLSIRGAINIGLADALPDINVVKCARMIAGHQMEGSLARSFILEYQVSGDDEVDEISQLSERFQRHVFVNSLLGNNLILPIQFDGWPIFDLDNLKGLITVKFKLIEFPTAIKFPSKRLTGSTMTNELQSRAETRLLATLTECSTWCDQIGCIALSYCQDKTCSLITLNMLRDGRRTKQNDQPTKDSLEPEELNSLSSSAVDGNCTYYLWTSTRPRSLDKFVGFMDDLINQHANPAELNSFILTPNTFTLIPTRFYEIKDDLELILDDRIESKDKLVVYKTIWYDRIVEPVRLQDLIKQEGNKLDYKFDIRQSRDYSECLETCKGAPECVAISHCKQKTTCLLITGTGDIKKLESALGPEMPDNLNCRVTVRDYSEEYRKFTETLQPASFELMVADYSALECASLCNSFDGSDDQRKLKCLSFDLCHEVGISTNAVCYLQKSHVMLDSFDKSIMSKRPHNDSSVRVAKLNDGQEQVGVGERDIICQHYSKALMADYKQIANKRLAQVEGQVVRGSTADKCAIECHEDNRCWAFEYCFDDKLKPAQSCYFIRTSMTEEGKPFMELINGLEQTLTPSNTCSIYRLSAMKQLGWTLQPRYDMKTPIERLVKFLKLLCIASLSVFVGLLVQMGYDEVVKKRNR